MPRYARILSKMEYTERLGLVFRRDPHSEFLVTVCGEWVINAYYPNKTTHIAKNENYRYLRMDGRDVHSIVGRTWVWNPNPEKFRVCDHIDGNSQNNHASNLRWVDYTLNALNKKDRKLAYKYKKMRKNGMSIWWRSRVVVRGKETSSNWSTKEAAEIETRLKLNELFLSYYADHRRTSDPAPPRADYMYYWADKPFGLTVRPDIFDSGDEQPGESGAAVTPVRSECDTNWEGIVSNEKNSCIC